MDKCLLIQSKFEDTSFPKKVDLIVSSPPYGIGKSYEGFETLENYISWAGVLAFSNENDVILDPFCGTGSTGCAAAFHNREFIGVDTNMEFINIAKERIASALDGTLKTRQIGTPIQEASASTKTRQIPEEWKSIREEQTKKPRLYPQYKEEDE